MIDYATTQQAKAFLSLLEADIAANPKRLKAFDGGLRDRLQSLVGDVEVDLDDEGQGGGNIEGARD